MSKKFYWLKLKEDFFTQPKIKKLRRIAGGDTYTIIYLKLQLLSLKNEGNLYFEGIEDDFIEELALNIDEDIDNVKMTIMYLIKQNLIEEVAHDEYSMTETKFLIGSESKSAQRVRKFRAEKKARELLHNDTKTLQCNDNMLQRNSDVIPCNNDVQPCNTNVQKCNTEIEIEIEKEPESKKKILKEKSFNEGSGFGSSNLSPSQPEIQPLTVGEFNNLTISEQELAELVQTYSREVVDRYINQVSNSLQRGTLKNVNSTYAIVKTFIQNDINNGRLTSPKKIHLGRAPTMPRVCPKCKRELDAAGRCLNCKIAAEFDKSKNQWVWIKLAPSHAVVDDWIRKKRGINMQM